MRHIVIGLDGSAGSAAAARWCAQLARATGSEVTAVHGLGAMSELLLGIPPSSLRDWKEELRPALHQWCEPLREAGVPCREEVIDDDPVGALIHTAEEQHADLVVVGAQGHSGFLHRVLGGVSYKLAHHAGRPVVIVPSEVQEAS